MSIASVISKFKYSPRENTCEIVVFDSMGSDVFLDYVFPGREIKCIPARNESFPISFVIMVNTILATARIIRMKFSLTANWKMRLKVAYYCALFEEFKPKVVLTFIDTNPYFSLLSEAYSKAHFCAFQNGLRLPYMETLTPYTMQHFFCYGQSDVDAFSKKPHNIGQIYKIGSILGEVARRRFEGIVNIEFDLCLVSQWRDKLMNTEDNVEVRDALFSLYEYANRLAVKHNLKLTVACAVSSESELKYFRENFDARTRIVVNNRKELRTYREIMASTLTLTAWSTVAMEAAGWGKKCVFVNSTSQRRFDVQVPDQFIVKSKSFDEFEHKVMSALKSEEKIFNSLGAMIKDRIMAYTDVDANFALIRNAIDKLEQRVQGSKIKPLL